MRVKYTPIVVDGDKIYLSGDSTKRMFPTQIVVIDDTVSDEYYLELNFKNSTPKYTRGLLLEVTDVTLYNKSGSVMEYYYWNPSETNGVWQRER